VSAAHPEIVLVLGAGGARGLGQIAVLEALDAMGARPARIVGCSIGAAIGAAYASGLSGAELRAHVLSTFRDRASVIARLLQARIGRIAHLRQFGNPILIDGERLLDLFWPQAVPDRFDGLAVPFAALAADFHRQRAVLVDSGPLTPAVAGSLAIPGLVRPVLLGGHVLVDGATVDPLPFEAERGLRRLVVAVDCGSGMPVGSDRVPSALEALVGASQILTRGLVRRKLAMAQPDILIRLGGDGIGVLDFFKARRILDAAAPAGDELRRALAQALSRAP
jgi:NTE family protein